VEFDLFHTLPCNYLNILMSEKNHYDYLFIIQIKYVLYLYKLHVLITVVNGKNE